MPARQDITRAVERLDKALSKRFKPRGRTPEARIAAALPKLPKRLRSSASDLLSASRRIRSAPNGPVPAAAPLIKRTNKVIAFAAKKQPSEIKAGKKARKGWFMGVLLNLAIGAAIFAAFIYIGQVSGSGGEP